MNNQDAPITISHGMDVLGSDGEKVGDVADMRGDFLVVSKGFFFPTDYFIPTSAIASVGDGSVYLTVTKDEALNQGWDVEPAFDETVTTETGFVDAGLQVQNPVPRTAEADYLADSGGTDVLDDAALRDESALRDDTETLTVPVVEEELTATKRGVDRGEVKVEKVVTAEDQTIEVPITEEQVHVTRRLVDRDAPVGEETFEEITIEVPIHGEEVDVQKRAHVVEEIDVTKESTTEIARVTDTVRREDVRVKDNTDDTIDDGKSL